MNGIWDYFVTGTESWGDSDSNVSNVSWWSISSVHNMDLPINHISKEKAHTLELGKTLNIFRVLVLAQCLIYTKTKYILGRGKDKLESWNSVGVS